MQVHHSADELPASRRFETWGDMMGDRLGIAVRAPQDGGEPFSAHVTLRAGGPLLHLDYDGNPHWAGRGNREIGRKPWNCYLLYQDRSSGTLVRQAGREFVASAGDLILADADVPYDTSARERYRFGMLLLPKPMLDPHLPRLGRAPLCWLSASPGAGALASSYLAALTANWGKLSEAAMPPLADTMARLIALACGAAPDDQADALRQGRLIEAQRYIDCNLADPALSPATTAASLRISVRALHLLFEPSGTTFARHVQRRRLEACRSALLATPTRPVLDIALAWGFGSMSTFYDAFRTTFGHSPRDLRAMRAA